MLETWLWRLNYLERKGSILISPQKKTDRKEGIHERKCSFIYHFDAPNGTARKLPVLKAFPRFRGVWGPGRRAHCVVGAPSPLGCGRRENRWTNSATEKVKASNWGILEQQKQMQTYGNLGQVASERKMSLSLQWRYT